MTRKTELRIHEPALIKGEEKVRFKFLGVPISEDLSWIQPMLPLQRKFVNDTTSLED